MCITKRFLQGLLKSSYLLWQKLWWNIFHAYTNTGVQYWRGGGWRHYHKKLLSLSLLRSLIHPTSPMASLLYTFLMSEMIRKNEVEGGGGGFDIIGGSSPILASRCLYKECLLGLHAWPKNAQQILQDRNVFFCRNIFDQI